MSFMNRGRQAPSSELREAIAQCRHAFIGVAVMSGLINILYLTGSFYMLEVYDRVLPSRSVPTLVALSVLAVTLFAFQGILDVVRSRIMVRVAANLDERLSAKVYDIVVQMPLRARGRATASRRCATSTRSARFLSRPALALFDLPWMPFYVAICFVFHPWIGVAALIGAVILSSLTLLSEFRTRGPSRTAMQHSSTPQRRSPRRAGATPRPCTRWAWRRASARCGARRTASYLASTQQTSDVAGGLGAVSKVLRFLLQSGVLGLGAYLVINQQATAGVIIAGSIIVARALAPVELAIANWKGFVAARQSWAAPVRIPHRHGRYHQADAAAGAEIEPRGRECHGRASRRAAALPCRMSALALKGGQGLGIIGPSASGKSSLARAHGRRLAAGARQGAPRWGRHGSVGPCRALGQHIGYLPQDVELFAGTVAQNIARFEPDAPADAVIAAGQAAGVHDMIVRLPEGYETQIGEGGARYPPASASVLRSRAPCTAIRSWSFSTNRTRTSMPTATGR